MQTVSSIFTAEEVDNVRKIAYNLQVSWKRESTLGNRTFTIGTSTIGGSGVIGINPGSIGNPANYRYMDESDYVTSLSWEQALTQPIGGINKSLANVTLDNTSGRFLPGFMGGDSPLYTSVYEPRKPMIINAGFDIGVDQTIPQFTGITNKSAQVDTRGRTVALAAGDYIDYFQNLNVDRTAMFTGQRTDQILETILTQHGMTTAQYDLDIGINTIGFAMIPSGAKFANVINDLVEAENGQFYQDEKGIFKFVNRLHWEQSPHNSVKKTIRPDIVLDAKSPDADHIINVVEVNYNPRVKTSSTTIFTQSGTITLPTGTTEVFIQFANPVLVASAPVYVANSASDGSGANVTGSVTVASTSLFAESCKYIFNNTSGSTAYITSLTVQGRWAVLRYETPQYVRYQDNSSVTAYQERTQTITNDYIQDPSWANSFSQLILGDFAQPENIQVITIRAIPELQLGDLISYQSVSWRVFKIRSVIDVNNGFVQELTLVKRELSSYFKIGTSTIGNIDPIAP